jgi:hypothetical protein
VAEDLIDVEVAYAQPEKQLVVALRVPAGTTLFDAAVQSGIVEHFPGLDLAGASMGMFGKLEKSPRSRIIQDGERVEIYRPLLTDPKEARKARAAKVREQKV